MFRAVALVVMLTLPVTACGRGQAGGSSGSGISGTVVAVPGCPAPSVPADAAGTSAIPGCDERPVAATVRIIDAASGEVVTETGADDHGHFELALTPGDYEAQVLAEDGTEAGPPLAVAVRMGEMTEVTLVYDTGIR